MRKIRFLGAIGIWLLTVAAARAGQPTPAQAAFEVASMKLHSPEVRPSGCQGGPGTRSPGQWTCNGVSLLALVIEAWGVDSRQISSPSFLGGASYDTAARVPPGTTGDEFNLMVRRLLTERLGMAVRYERKEMDVKELIVAKGGLKMKAAEPAPAEVADGAPPGMGFDQRLGVPILPPGYPMMVQGVGAAGVFLVGRMQSVDELARALRVDRLVVNKTGLTGKYDYAILYALVTASALPDDPSSDSPLYRGLPVESAIVEQLGLQLRAAKETVDILVVDRFSKTPTEN